MACKQRGRKKKPAGMEMAPYNGQGPVLPLLSYQKRWVHDKSRFKMGLWARQTGKSFSTSLEAVDDCLEQRTDWVFLSSGERQSKELIRKAKMHTMAYNAAVYDQEATYKTGKGAEYKQLEILFENGSRILALPANPDTARGHSANVVLDEFAFHGDSRKIWAALFPTITRGYKIRIISTPQGKKNKFYELWSGGSLYSKHKVDIYLAVREGLPIRDDQGNLVGPEYLKEALDDDEAWTQEYECQFLDEATAWIPYELISLAEVVDLGEVNIWQGGPIYAGIDIGRKSDITVFWAFEMIGDVLWSLEKVELSKTSFTDQLNILSEKMNLLKPRRVCIDCTGLGMHMAETLQNMYGESMVEQVHFRNTVKEDLAITAKSFFEDRRIRIPVDRKIREDIHNIRKTVTSAGNARFDAERTKDGHSDRFWAIALAAHAAKDPMIADIDIVVGVPRETARLIQHY